MKNYRNNKFGAILTNLVNSKEEFTDAQLDKIPTDKLFYYLLIDGETEYMDIIVKEDFDIDGIYIHQAAVERDIEIYRENYGDEFVNGILAE